MADTEEVQQAGLSDLEIISQPAEDENQYLTPPVQLVSFGYRDLPLAALDLSLAGSQLLSNADEDENRDGSNWLKPCCGRRVALWQVCMLSAGFNCILVACVVLVVLFLSLELMIDTKLLQYTPSCQSQRRLLLPPVVVPDVSNAFQFASIIHWISLIILSLFFSEDLYDSYSNLQTYVLQVKVEMELEIQQCEKTKAVREEQLERLTQICQEQAFEIRQLRAHLAQQDLDLAAEREAAMQIHHVWGKQGRSFQVVEGSTPGESDDEGGQRNLREPHGAAGTVNRMPKQCRVNLEQEPRSVFQSGALSRSALAHNTHLPRGRSGINTRATKKKKKK
ncbi:Transmembrane protein 266 [Liparis tanakae]|uniref:Transmembrane protein 266 n=1 Tax=Liparis tanakae TaxID=230148 RepID=A0A4Z2JC74_9TELE|nr:Transmembrane protein 266 [Liparis tanakae]